MPVEKLHHELFEKIKNQDGVQDGWHKQENSITELHILNVLCLKCSFYVLINKYPSFSFVYVLTFQS